MRWPLVFNVKCHTSTCTGCASLRGPLSKACVTLLGALNPLWDPALLHSLILAQACVWELVYFWCRLHVSCTSICLLNSSSHFFTLCISNTCFCLFCTSLRNILHMKNCLARPGPRCGTLSLHKYKKIRPYQPHQRLCQSVAAIQADVPSQPSNRKGRFLTLFRKDHQITSLLPNKKKMPVALFSM